MNHYYLIWPLQVMPFLWITINSTAFPLSGCVVVELYYRHLFLLEKWLPCLVQNLGYPVNTTIEYLTLPPSWSGDNHRKDNLSYENALFCIFTWHKDVRPCETGEYWATLNIAWRRHGRYIHSVHVQSSLGYWSAVFKWRWWVRFCIEYHGELSTDLVALVVC